MPESRWDKIQLIFEEALTLQDEKREAFLVEKCGHDKELLKEVSDLINADSTENSLLDSSPFSALDSGALLDLIGQEVGPYKITRKLGEGGMGAVFLAARTSQDFEQEVALKLLNFGLPSEHLMQRFNSERQILAGLDHPNIARLFDGGVSKQGWPFFTMEYVHGLPVTEFCKQNQLTVEAQLELFIVICDAVQYAHRNLVIHRDIKPANILVREDGTVKLLDFGIAKILSADRVQPALTQTGVLPMTPEYASPEQIKGEPITTASDIYSLGVLLYELLAGERPFQFKTRQPSEIEKIICESQPTRPSQTVRESSGRSLKSKLAGELDKICLMALRKEPERRYDSVEQFKNDIKNYLSNLPVVAQGESFGYIASKFALRNRLLLSSVAIACTIIIGLIVGYTIQLKTERDKALFEQQKTEQIAEFLSDLFKVSDPSESRGEEITARELLEKGAEKVETELAEQPSVLARVLGVIGNVYESLGLYDQAEKNLEQSLDLTKSEFGERSLPASLALAELADAVLNKADFSRAESLIVEAFSIQKELPNVKELEFLKTKLLLGEVAFHLGEFNRADSLYNLVLEGQTRSLPENHKELGRTYNAIASVQISLGDFEKAEVFYRKALRVYEQEFGAESANVAVILNDLAYTLRKQGKLDIAEEMYRKVMKLNERIYSADHPNTGWTLNHLSRLFSLTGKLDEAEPMARRALKIRIAAMGEAHPATAASRGNLASILSKKNRLKEAEVLYRENEKQLRKLGGEHPHVAAATFSVGRILMKQGRFLEAELHLENSLKIHRKTLPVRHPRIAQGLTALGEIYLNTNRAKEAELVFVEGLEIFTNSNANAKVIASAEMWLAKSFLVQSKVESAVKHLQNARQIAESDSSVGESLRDEIKRLLNKTQTKAELFN